MDVSKVAIFTDGACRGNNKKGQRGQMSSAFIIFDCANSKQEWSASKYLGIGTNNRAEYHAIIGALTYALTIQKKFATQKITILLSSDSLLAINQINGVFQCHDKKLQPLLSKIHNICCQFTDVSFRHVEREHPNIIRVDQLCNDVLDAFLNY